MSDNDNDPNMMGIDDSSDGGPEVDNNFSDIEDATADSEVNGTSNVTATGDNDDETELVVLDQDHPLMKRFQEALKKLLTKENYKAEIERRELTERAKKKKEEQVELGNELYNLQQELARNQMILQNLHDQFAAKKLKRQQIENELDNRRRVYTDTIQALNVEKKKEASLRQENDNLALRLFYIKNAKEDVRGDIAVMRRAAEKADEDLTKAESIKMKQDLLVDRLTDRVDRLQEEIAIYDAQLVAQQEETKTAKQTLMEGQLEIQTIAMERRHLMSEWHSSLIGLQRRNEAFSAMMQTLNDNKQKILSLVTEIDGFKKSIGQEQILNEKLTSILNKTESDINTVKKMLNQCQTKEEMLKQEYATYNRMLQTTESSLTKVNVEKQQRENELDALRKQIEQHCLQKVKLEDDIVEIIRSKLTLKKAAEYTKKLTNKLHNRTREMETQVAIIENEIAKNGLEILNTKARVDQKNKAVQELNDDIKQKNDVISKCDLEMNRNNVLIERKQGVIDQLNKKLEQIIISAGGVELGPLEITINSLSKSIVQRQDENANLEQMWLRDQLELVRLLNDKEAHTQDVNKLKQQLNILIQKKLRIEGQIETELREKGDIERDLRHLQNDMVKLNGLLYKERDAHENLEKGNMLIETDFVRALKEQEMESFELTNKLEELREEKERLLDCLLEAEKQNMLWEKKIQLAQETRATVDSEVGQGEIKTMKTEIHRMKVRLQQLLKQQEMLIQGMEKSVSRRETIMTRVSAQQKMKQKVETKTSVQREVADIRKKIKQSAQASKESEEEIAKLRGEQMTLSQEIEEKQNQCNQLQHQIDNFNEDLVHLTEKKQIEILELHNKQQVARYYQQLKDGKYVKLFRNEAALQAERQKQMNRTQALHLILDRMCREFPQIQRDVGGVRQMIARRLEQNYFTE